MPLGLLLVAIAAITWGTVGSVFKLLSADTTADPLVVGAIRMLLAVPLLLGMARIRHGAIRLRGWAFVPAGLCMAAFQFCYFSAVPLAGVAATALLSICSAPVLIAVMARLFLGEPLTPTRLLSLGLGLTGATLLGTDSGLAVGAGFAVGAALALGAGASYALYAVLTKHSLGGVPPLTLAGLTFGVSALALAPTLARAGEVGTLIGHGWPELLYLGIVPTALAYALYTTGLRRAPATAVAIVGLLEPLTATVLGILVFRERLALGGTLGVVLLLGAVLLLQVAPAGPGRASAVPVPEGLPVDSEAAP